MLQPAELGKNPAKVPGGKARAKSFTSEYQRNARSHVRRESLQRSARLSVAARRRKALEAWFDRLTAWVDIGIKFRPPPMVVDVVLAAYPYDSTKEEQIADGS